MLAWIRDIGVILSIILTIISIYKFIIPRFKTKPDLHIRILECYHCYIEEMKLSRIYVNIYFLNREEKKEITIKDIKLLDVFGEDLIGSIEKTVSDYKPQILEPLKPDKIRIRINISNVILSQPIYEFNLLIKYNNKTKIILSSSRTMQSLCKK